MCGTSHLPPPLQLLVSQLNWYSIQQPYTQHACQEELLAPQVGVPPWEPHGWWVGEGVGNVRVTELAMTDLKLNLSRS